MFQFSNLEQQQQQQQQQMYNEAESNEEKRGEPSPNHDLPQSFKDTRNSKSYPQIPTQEAGEKQQEIAAKPKRGCKMPFFKWLRHFEPLHAIKELVAALEKTRKERRRRIDACNDFSQRKYDIF